MPKGTLVIRAAEELGIQIPRFCDHPLLEPVGACRQCLVEVATPGPDGRCGRCPSRRPPARSGRARACRSTRSTRRPVADKAQHGVMELLLINHPLDCPVCDKGGECPLQNQAMSNGRAHVPVRGRQAHLPQADQHLQPGAARPRALRPVRALHPVLRADRRRPVHRPARARRPAAGRHLRGPAVRVVLLRQHRADLPGRRADRRGVPVPVAPVRPGLHPGVCEHCASRLLDPHRPPPRRGAAPAGRRTTRTVNEEWNCDKGRWAFPYATRADRITIPLVRDGDGELRAAGWPEALARPRPAGLRARPRAPACSSAAGSRSRTPTPTASSPASRCTPTTSTSAPARTRRRRPTFLAQHVVATGPDGGAVTYADLERAKAVLLVGFEPEEESPIVFLRLRKGVRRNKTQRVCGRALRDRGLDKLRGPLLPAAPGTEAEVLRDLGGSNGRPLPRCEALAGRRRSSSSASGWPPCPAPCRRPPPSRSAPAPGWRGSRAGPASAVRSRPARCRALLPGGRPVGECRGPRRRRRGLGRRRAARHGGPRHRRHHRRGRSGPARRARRRRRRPGRPARPRRRGGAGQDRSSSRSRSATPR